MKFGYFQGRQADYPRHSGPRAGIQALELQVSTDPAREDIQNAISDPYRKSLLCRHNVVKVQMDTNLHRYDEVQASMTEKGTTGTKRAMFTIICFREGFGDQ